MRLINVDEAINRLEDLNVASFYEENEDSREAYHEIKQMLEDLPIVDAIPRKQGYWVRWYEEIHDSFGVALEPHCKCSECEMEYDPYYANTVNYCSHCGARMEAKNAVN